MGRSLVGRGASGLALDKRPELVERHGDDQDLPVDHMDDGVGGRLSHIRRGKYDVGGIDDDTFFLPRFSGNIDVT